MFQYASLFWRLRLRTRLVVAAFAVTQLYGLRLFFAEFVTLRIPNKLQDLLTLSTSVIVESMPFVLLGMLLSILVQVWLPEDFLLKILPKRPAARRVALSLLGIFLPVCECGNVPLARGLISRGFTASESIVFLLAAPILNPVTILTTYQAFGQDHSIVVARVVAGFLIANSIGWLFSRNRDENSLLNTAFAATCVAPPAHRNSRLTESVALFKREANVMLPALFVGSLIAGLVQVFVPREVLTSLGGNPVWSIGAMMILAIIVSICSNVDAFFALAFRNVFTAGSIVSFLVLGPIIDIKMLSLMKTTYRPVVLLKISVLAILMSFLTGLVVNYAF